MTDADTQIKTFECYFTIDWKNEEIRQPKSEPTDVAPTELAIPVSLDIDVLEMSVRRLRPRLTCRRRKTNIRSSRRRGGWSKDAASVTSDAV